MEYSGFSLMSNIMTYVRVSSLCGELYAGWTSPITRMTSYQSIISDRLINLLRAKVPLFVKKAIYGDLV